VISPDGKKVAFSKAVQVEDVLGKDKYKDLPKTTAQIYTDLNHRHWDAWNEGSYNHVFVANVSESADKAKDLLEGKAFDSPQKPFGGAKILSGVGFFGIALCDKGKIRCRIRSKYQYRYFRI
jgi:hypothetical protein